MRKSEQLLRHIELVAIVLGVAVFVVLFIVSRLRG